MTKVISREIRIAHGLHCRFKFRAEPTPKVECEWDGSLPRRLPRRVKTKALESYRRGRDQFLATVAAKTGWNIAVVETANSQHAAQIELELAPVAGNA